MKLTNDTARNSASNASDQGDASSGSEKSTMEKLLLTPEEAATTLGISRSKLYVLLRRGDITSVRIDGSRRIPSTELTSFVDGLERHWPATVQP